MHQLLNIIIKILLKYQSDLLSALNIVFWLIILKLLGLIKYYIINVIYCVYYWTTFQFSSKWYRIRSELSVKFVFVSLCAVDISSGNIFKLQIGIECSLLASALVSNSHSYRLKTLGSLFGPKVPNYSKGRWFNTDL